MTLAGRHVLRKPLLQVAAVRQSGQWIVQGLVLEMMLGFDNRVPVLFETGQHLVEIFAKHSELVARIDF